MKSRILSILLISSTAFFLIAGRSDVYAQTFNVSVYPPQIHVIMKPGKSILQAYSFENRGDPGFFRLALVSFKPSGDSGGRVLSAKAEGPVRFSIENLNLDFKKPFFLGANKKIQVLLKIRSTQQAPEQDYYYTLFLISNPPITQQTASRGVGALGTNILITITSDARLETKFSVVQLQPIVDLAFTVFKKPLYITKRYRRIPVVFKISNKGENLFAPNAEIVIRGPMSFKQKKKMAPVTVLAHSDRLLTQEDSIDCPTCTGSVSTVFSPQWWGKYIISASVSVEGSRQKAFETVVLWVLPLELFKYMAIVFVTLILIIIALRVFAKGSMQYKEKER